MDINRMTQKVQEALAAAQSIAARNNHQQVDVEHLALALLEQDGGLAGSILAKAGTDANGLAERIKDDLNRLPRVSGPSGAPDQIYVTGRLNKLLAEAEAEARKLKDEYVSVEHLLLAMLGDGGATGRRLQETGLTRERLAQALKGIRVDNA